MRLLFGIVLIGYLLGSIPWGLIAGAFAGVDIRQHGSGNIGATNVLRVLGKPWGFAVFFADALKGFLAVRFAFWMVSTSGQTIDYPETYAIIAAAACVAGHSFPVWLKFRGGKGVATSAGALFGVVPAAALTIFLVWVVIFLSTRYVSLASMLAALALPFAVAFLEKLQSGHGPALIYFSIAMTALVIWRHRANISRLLKGTEPRFTRK